MNIADHLVLGIAAFPSGPSPDGKPAPDVRPVLLKTWDPVCQGLASGDLDAALISLPLAIDLYAKGLDIALVMLSHRGGSVLSSRKDLTRLTGFRGKSLLIPHRLSIQHMLMHKLMADQGLTLEPPPASSPDAVCAEALPMGLMPEITRDDTDGDIAGFISPAPFAARAAELGHMKPLLTTQALWKNHPCCGLVVRRRLLADEAGLTPLVRALFRAAARLQANLADPAGPAPDLTAAAADFLGQSPGCTRDALTRSGITYRPDLLVPEPAPLETVQTYMARHMDLLSAPVDLEQFVYPLFAKTALSELDI